MRRALAALLAGLLAVVAACAPAPVADAGAQSPTRIDSCTTVSEPGRYVLVADVEAADAGQCLRIRASDVVLEGRDRAVNGTGAFGTAGVTVGTWDAGVSNVTVRNLTVSGWDDGVRLTNVAASAVAGVTATGSRIGVLAMNATGTRFVDVRATGNAVHGVSLDDASRGNALEDVTAADNALFGVRLGADAADNEVRNATARGNEYGVVLAGADGNRVVGGAATDNRVAGVWLSLADDNLVADVRLSNRFYGVFAADESANNTVRNATAVGNAVGFRFRSAHGNRLVDSVATDGRDGVLLIASDRNRVVGNRVTDNRRGVSVFDSDDNAFRDNEVRGNGRDVLVRRGSENSTVRASGRSAPARRARLRVGTVGFRPSVAPPTRA